MADHANKNSFIVGDQPVAVRSGNVIRGDSWSAGPEDHDDSDSYPLSGENKSGFFFIFLLNSHVNKKKIVYAL